MKTRKRRREELDAERQEVLAAIERGRWDDFRTASKELRADFEVALAAVEYRGYNLKYVSEKLKNNHEVVFAAVRQNWFALNFASTALQANHDVVMAAVQLYGRALQFASSELRADRNVVSAAVRKNGSALQYASPALRADKELVLTAIRDVSSWDIFQYAAFNLRDDHDFVARAITASPGIRKVLPYASDFIKSDLRDAASKFETVGQARTFLHDNVQSRNSFMEFLLCVTSETTPEENPVTMVNIGDRSTFVELHRHIAEYVGVPLGQELEPVRLAKRVMPILDASCQDNDEIARRLEEAGVSPQP